MLCPTPPVLYSTPSEISPFSNLSGVWLWSISKNSRHSEFGLSSVRFIFHVDLASLSAVVGVDNRDGEVKVRYKCRPFKDVSKSLHWGFMLRILQLMKNFISVRYLLVAEETGFPRRICLPCWFFGWGSKGCNPISCAMRKKRHAELLPAFFNSAISIA